METNEHKRLKVLLGCYACNPFYGSEPGTGWNFLTQIAKHHDVHAIVEEEVGKDDLLRYQQQHPEELKNVTFHFIKRRRFRLLRKLWPPSYYWTYRCWQKKAYKLAKVLDEVENFDLVHQITLVGYREPGYLWKLEKPFIWGPLGGFCQTSWRLLPGLNLYNIIYFTLRNILNAWQMRYSYAARKVSTVAHSILVSDPKAEQDIRAIWKRESIVMREVGTQGKTEKDFPLSSHQAGTPLKICWTGNLISLKALDILIRALPFCKQPMTLNVIGKGKKLVEWKKLAARLGVENNVIFHGYVDHNDVGQLMASCHVFCITSLKEGGTPTVALEALQYGLPLIVLDHCGFSSVVNDTCGYKVPLNNKEQISRHFASILDNLAEDEVLRKKLAMGAIERSHDFTWENKMAVLNQIYSQATAKSKQED